jgi:hypothetical protein
MGSGSTTKIGSAGIDSPTYHEARERLRETLGKRPSASTIDALKDVYMGVCGERVLFGGAAEERYAQSLLHFARQFGKTRGSLKNAYRRFLDNGHQCPEESPAKRSFALSDVFDDLAFQYMQFAAIQRAAHPSSETITLETVAVQAKRIAQVLREKPLDDHDLSTLARLSALLKNIRTQSLGERFVMLIEWNERGGPVLPYHFDHLVRHAGDVDYDQWEKMLRRVFTGHKRIRVEPYDLGLEAGFDAYVGTSFQIVERIVIGAVRLSADLSQTIDGHALYEMAVTAPTLSPRTIGELLDEQMTLSADLPEEEDLDDLVNPDTSGERARSLERFYNVLSTLRTHSLLTLISKGEIQFVMAFLHVFQLWQWRPHVSVDILLHVAASQDLSNMKAQWIGSMLEMLHAPAHLSWSLKNHLDTKEHPFLTLYSLDEFWNQLSIFLDPREQRRLGEMDDKGSGQGGSSAPVTPATGGAAPVSSDPGTTSAAPVVTDFEELEAKSGASKIGFEVIDDAPTNRHGAMAVHARASLYKRGFIYRSGQLYKGARTYMNPAMTPQRPPTVFRPVMR